MNKKTRVTIPFDPDKLLDVLVAKMSLQDLASKTGTSPADFVEWVYLELSLIHISEPTRPY